MHLGIVTPVLIQHPSARSEWEASADIGEIATVAATADRLGFHHLTCSEHVAVPEEIAAERGGTYWDPLATLGFLAARTSRILLATQVLVLGYHHPLEIAKRYGTLDRVSNGRLILGLGVGTLKQEFDLINAPFADRGARADDALAALRASLSTPTPEYHGEFYDYSGFVVEPHAVQKRVPLWIGGRTKRSLRRATTHGDGWVPFGLRFSELKEMLDATTLPDGFDVVLPAGAPLDPLGNRESTLRALTLVRDAGATIASCSVGARSVEHYCEQLEELHRIALTEGFSFTTS
ncbi:TIGR03619 family F420-dependent LLM class oxidoreductase [Rhodococcus qingshengii]|jgi:probable F420-dependent oxidoreductase|uniref:TIGR03619 family F420-dependent LLM class oxidoreductase n=1 Tax=Rhodococcus qingshengii TaxID=334542 RepID=A0AAW6LNH7_RHOSG|nr:TIGR03619 family F420-dependent LLM class oxidoreductase [Rhodococcus qingshengii]MDE8648544.1 TIGR03619 family F420-dependent LLM class oxidoreductase [Rhodococcus qingshengii]